MSESSKQKSIIHGLVMAGLILGSGYVAVEGVRIATGFGSRAVSAVDRTITTQRRKLTNYLVRLELEGQLEKAGKKGGLVPIDEMSEQELRYALGSNVGKLDQCRETLEEIKTWAGTWN